MIKPLLSICIPTYNRSKRLINSIESIIKQPEFTPENVEIVVSDNCSPDDTQEVMKKYTDKYTNIHYFRNDKNVTMENFPIVMSEAIGLFRKLSNDTCIYIEGSLNKILTLIKENEVEKPSMFFLYKKNKKNEYIYSLEKFLYSVEHYITWIGGFGLWDNECNDIRNNTYGCAEYLWQVPLFLDTVELKKKSIVVRDKLLDIESTEKKNVFYSFYEIFYINYLNFINVYVKKGSLSIKCYKWLEKRLLFKFFTQWMILYETQKKEYLYTESNSLIKAITETYSKKSYYPLFLVYYTMKKSVQKFKKLIKFCLTSSGIKD